MAKGREPVAATDDQLGALLERYRVRLPSAGLTYSTFLDMV